MIFTSSSESRHFLHGQLHSALTFICEFEHNSLSFLDVFVERINSGVQLLIYSKLTLRVVLPTQMQNKFDKDISPPCFDDLLQSKTF